MQRIKNLANEKKKAWAARLVTTMMDGLAKAVGVPVFASKE
jgi:hypothetical protein